MSECVVVSLLDCCLSDLKTVKDFNNLVMVINFYHFNRCNGKNCRYCSFVRGLNTICEKLEKEKNRRVLEKEFQKVLSLWNKKKDTMPSPHLDPGQ